MITNTILHNKWKIAKIDKNITKAKGVKKLPLTVYIWRETLERLTAPQAWRVFIYTRLHGYVSRN